jgi:hypothetical protein
LRGRRKNKEIKIEGIDFVIRFRSEEDELFIGKIPPHLPWQSILQLESVAGMRDGVHVWIEAGDKFACASRNHRDARSQQTLIAESTDESEDSVRRPGCYEEEADGDAGLGNAHFNRGFGRVLIRSQALDIHLLGLSFQGLLVIHDMRHNLAVVVDNHAHGDDVGECENRSHEHSVVEGVGQIVEGAGCEIAFRHVASPELQSRDCRPRYAGQSGIN